MFCEKSGRRTECFFSAAAVLDLYHRKSLILQTNLHLGGVRGLEHQNRLSGCTVEGQVDVVDVDVALGQGL